MMRMIARMRAIDGRRLAAVGVGPLANGVVICGGLGHEFRSSIAVRGNS